MNLSITQASIIILGHTSFSHQRLCLCSLFVSHGQPTEPTTLIQCICTSTSNLHPQSPRDICCLLFPHRRAINILSFCPLLAPVLGFPKRHIVCIVYGDAPTWSNFGHPLGFEHLLAPFVGDTDRQVYDMCLSLTVSKHVCFIMVNRHMLPKSGTPLVYFGRSKRKVA